MRINNILFNALYFIRKLMPDNIYYSKLLIPARIMLGNKIKNRKRGSLRFDVHVADHCNINCKGCEHFSPIAPKHFVDIEKYTNDCIQLAKLSGANDCGGGGGSISEIALLGGEPLLNPQINDVIKISRSYFHTAAINIVTNGLPLKNQPKEFWDCCRTNNICIKISVYPVCIDYSFLIETAKKYGVQIQFRGNVKLVSKNWKELPIDYMAESWRQIPIDLEGRQNPKKSNALCYASNFCFQLVEGKLYKCWRTAYAKDFNRYFNKQLEVTEDDYVDIYKAANIDEMLEKLRKPAPFCRYCKMDGAKLVEWGKSKREISEWITD